MRDAAPRDLPVPVPGSPGAAPPVIGLLAESVLPPGRLMVAVSGGMDSMVLLHLLRFASGRGIELTAAHLDHAMRPGSAGDAAWVRGVCRAWGVPLEQVRLPSAPGSEAEAREARYAFLDEARERAGCVAVVVAHHADDQAETVLFRVLRGTGVAGLRGMDPVRGRIVRPLLGRWRRELRDYARRWRVPFREDPTNLDSRFARNALRHIVLPAAEETVATGSRGSLVRLAANAARAHEELRVMEEWALQGALREPVPGRVEVDAALVEGLPAPLRARLARRAARRLGMSLTREATDRAVDGFGRLHPGRRLDLTGGVLLERGPGAWIFLAPGLRPRGREAMPEGPSIRVEDPAGEAFLRLGRAGWRVAWGPEPRAVPGEVALADPGLLPLTVRGWSPGDRIRLRAGSRPVSKVLGEAGIPRIDRPSSPVALDALDRVVWVPGVVLSADLGPASGAGSGVDRGDALMDATLYVSCLQVDHG